ncbi:TPA: hypothetical protein DIC40_02895 [Patescibacteria group bacterium]|nr:hypothetical protein [Candidatus Gracilibacteria bacterium]
MESKQELRYYKTSKLIKNIALMVDVFYLFFIVKQFSLDSENNMYIFRLHSQEKFSIKAVSIKILAIIGTIYTTKIAYFLL